MGYTHYWEFDGDAETFARTALDAKAIIEHEAAILAGPMGTGDPVLNEGEIAFNGREDQHGDYETFSIRAEATGFDFCKTRGDMPYDVAVTAVLIRFAQHGVGHVKVSSDGEWDDWAEGRALVDKLFGDCPKRSVFNR